MAKSTATASAASTSAAPKARRTSRKSEAAAAPAPAPVATPEPAAKVAAVQMFYTRTDSKGTPVSLWLNQNATKGSPDIDGKIGDLRVAGYIQKGSKGAFLSLIDSAAGKGDNGMYTQVGLANLVLNGFGIPKLAIRLSGVEGTVWAETAIRADKATLIAMGLNEGAQVERKAAHAASKEAVAA